MQTIASFSYPRRVLCTGILFGILSITLGCGSSGKDPKNQVTGKVTLDGKVVAGTVFFQFSDNKEVTALIATDGSYQIVEPPTGQAKVYVKSGMGVAVPPIGKAPEVKGGPEMPKDIGGATGTAPPAKYGSPSTSGLSFEVKGGKQTYDITLTP